MLVHAAGQRLMEQVEVVKGIGMLCTFRCSFVLKVSHYYCKILASLRFNNVKLPQNRRNVAGEVLVDFDVAVIDCCSSNSFVQQTCISQSLPKGPVDVLAAFGHLLLLIPNALQTLMHGKAFRQRTNLVERDVKRTKTRLWV